MLLKQRHNRGKIVGWPSGISQDGFMSAGAHRLTGEPAALMPGQGLFTFAAGA